MFRRVVQQNNKFIRFYTTQANINVNPQKPIRLFVVGASTPVTTADVFTQGKRVVVFGLPGAFTPVRIQVHFLTQTGLLKQACSKLC